MSYGNSSYGQGGDPYAQGGYGQSGQSDYGQAGGYGQQADYGQAGGYGQPGGYQQPGGYSQPSAPDAYSQTSAPDPYSQSSAPDPYGQGNYQQPSYDQQGYAGQQGGYDQQGYAGQQAGYGVQPYAGAYMGGYDAAHPPRPSVGFVDAVKLMFKNYANFYGRSSRSEFWWAYLGYMIAFLVPYLLAAGLMSTGTDAGFGIGVLFMIIAIVVALGSVVPMLANMVRRLHDTGKSGWYYFMSLIPFVGGIILLVMLAGESNPAGVRFDNPDGSQPVSQA